MFFDHAQINYSQHTYSSQISMVQLQPSTAYFTYTRL